MEGSWHWRLNPFHWSKRAIRVFVAGFFLIMLPVYLYIGFQPALPAEALHYPVLEFSAIHLSTPVAPLQLTEHQLIAPSAIAGAYSQHENKILIIGHSSTVFKRLSQATPGMTYNYDGETYIVTSAAIVAKEEISMPDILSAAEKPTIVMMTCAGEALPDQDATHRLIVTAIRE